MKTTVEKAVAHLGDLAKENNKQTTHEYTTDLLQLATTTYRGRTIGTAATGLVYLACGRADALVNHATIPWDIEAGGIFSIQHAKNRTINVYSNGKLHQAIEHLVTPSEKTK